MLLIDLLRAWGRLRRRVLVPVQQVEPAEPVPAGVQHVLQALRLRAAGHRRQRGRLPLLRPHDHAQRTPQVPVKTSLDR
jgi:hypothetical protein